jgi:hypothetical protein
VSTADVTIEAVDAVSRDLHKYRDLTYQIRHEYSAASRTILDFIDDVIRDRSRAAVQSKAELEHAVDAERRANEYDTPALYRPDVNGALHRLNQAESALDRARRVREAVLIQFRECERAIAANASAVEAISDAARRLLSQKREALEEYWAGQAGVHGRGPSGSAAPAPSPQLDKKAPGIVLPGLPAKIQLIALSDIDDSDSHVTGPETFGKGYSPADLRWAHEALHEIVMPTLASGGTLEDLRARDAAEGRMGVRSYADTYSGFFGDSAIRLGPDLEVTNGYHRIWVAKQMGLSHVPAVIE